MQQTVMVSAYCLAFNHGPYIRDALEGFVNQKTNFRYEVWVHDDASTDQTPAIIREYAQKYPDIIKPVFQTENQYSQGVQISRQILYPRMTGRYLAICEGDDYWCDENKLQKQVDFLESHPEYSACVHNTNVLNCQTGSMSPLNASREDKDLRFREVVNAGNAEFQLSSLLCRRELFLYPAELTGYGFGDYPLSVYLMLKGKIRYFKEIMSVYRFSSLGSWTSRNLMEASHRRMVDTQKRTTDFTCALYRYCQSQSLTPEQLEDVKRVAERNELQLYAMQYGLRGLLKTSERRKMFAHINFKQKQWVLDTGWKEICRKKKAK